MKIRTLLIGAALAALATPALAQDKNLTLKLSHWVPATHPLQKSMEEWGASVEKASNGTIKSNVYPAQQLGKAPDHYDMTRDGIVDFAYINPGYQPGRFPIVSAGELPFLVGEAHGGSGRLMPGTAVRPGRDEGREALLLIHSRPVADAPRAKKVVVPADIKGTKIRPAQATMAAWMTQLGGTNVSSSPSEIRDLLRRASPTRPPRHTDRSCCSGSTR
jgi:TRAP-type C4-dicarboxylate transport system substrate-binding protein